jgi:N-methylhydantoinase B
MAEIDVITQEVIRARLDGIVREMQGAVLRTGYSTIIRESYDFSCAILDRDGNTVGQHAGLPVHMGAYPECVKGVLRFYGFDEMEEGDCFLTNHPYYSGCPHPTDMVVVAPVFHERRVVAFCASMGHKSDIGGQSPGSRNAAARDLFGEGLQILPVKFLRRRAIVKEVEQFLRANSRTPELVIGDLLAQAGALWSVGSQRLIALMDGYGQAVTLEAFEQIALHTEQRIRREIATWPDGVYEAEAFIDNLPATDTCTRIHVAVTKQGDRLVLDFSGCGDQVEGPINVRPPFINGTSYFCTIAMIDPSLPNNYGLARAVECRYREGSILNPIFPAPVGFYSQTVPVVEDAILAALTQAAGRPRVAQAASGALLTIGSRDHTNGRSYVQYEILTAGTRGFAGGDGYSGTGQGALSGGVRLASIEILESEFDVRMLQFRVIPDSGGAGTNRGGLGIRRDYLIKNPSVFSGGTNRHLAPSRGVLDGADGRAGRTVVNPGTADEKTYLGRVSNVMLQPGNVLRMETGGAGGVGDPRQRDRALVEADLANGFITEATAREVYGLRTDD